MAETSTLPYYLAAPEQPSAVPGLKDVAAQAVETIKTPAQILADTPKPPSREDVDAARVKRDEAAERMRRNQEDRATNIAAQIEAAQVESRAYADKAREGMPGPPQIPPQPSRGLRPFLASSENEPAEASIQKFLQAMGLFATMVGGGRAGARASLSAMTGALEGWRAGDRDRGDRAYADWKAKTNTVLEQWDREMKSYEVALRAEGVPIEQRIAMMKLQAQSDGNFLLADQMDVANADKSVGELEHRQKAYADVALRAAEIQGKKDASDQKHEENIQKLEQLGDYRTKLLELKAQQAAQQQEQAQALVKQYTENPEMLKSLGQQWFLSGKMPALASRGKQGDQIRPLIVKAGIEWAKGNGIDPMAAPSIRAELAAAQSGLVKLTGANAIQQAAIRRLDGHLDALVTLSDKVPRSEMPAINNAILKGQRDFQGSPEAAQYVFQSFEVAMELSRVVVGTAQGDASTREEARQQIAAAFNPAQIKGVVAQLRSNAHRNLDSNRESEKAASGVIEAIQGARAPQGAKPTQGGTMRIRRKSDGKVFEGPRGAVPDGYEAAGG